MEWNERAKIRRINGKINIQNLMAKDNSSGPSHRASTKTKRVTKNGQSKVIIILCGFMEHPNFLAAHSLSPTLQITDLKHHSTRSHTLYSTDGIVHCIFPLREYQVGSCLGHSLTSLLLLALSFAFGLRTLCALQ